ncbi:MAG: hypothetical protein L0H55_15030 [Candidatus Nitrosocosmicus sp.]|nr:hypothetical protein [Candidatus Nitrosocosmicus sp.]
MSVSVDPDKSNYIGLINESVHTSDDLDIGDVYAINKFFLVVKRGYLRMHYYYIPIEKVDGWDGHVLWLALSEEEVIKYERDIFPNPLRYYVKGFEYEEMPPPVPNLKQIASKSKPFTEMNPYNKDNKDIDIFKCDLCDEVLIKEDEYKKHIVERHL